MGKSKLVLTARVFMFAVFMILCTVSADWAAATDTIARIWAVDDCEKIRQDDLSNPLATDYANNKVWNGNRVNIFGGRNEIVGFQLIIEGGTAGASSVNVGLPNLTNGQYKIQNDPVSAGDPYDYRGKRIELFTESYVNVPSRTNALYIWWNPDKPLPDSEFTGMMPDALIPFEAQSSKGGAPFNIAARKNQGVWVDVYIPKHAPAGTYTGTIQVKVGSSVIQGIPIELRVYGFTIPDETHLKNFFFGEGSGAHGLTGKHRASYDLNNNNYKLLEGRYFQMAHRHRFDLTFNADLIQMDSHYKRYVTGSYYSYSNGYDGPGIGWPHTTYSIETFLCPGSFSPDNESGWRTQSDAWVNWFEQNAPQTQFFKYMYDEPTVEMYPAIMERANWVHNNPGPGKRLKIYKDGIMDPRLFGYIDFWVVTGQSGYYDNVNPAYAGGGKLGYQPALAAQRRALGESVGIYNGSRPSFGAGQIIDAPGTEFRANPWLIWKYNVDQYFLWHTTIWNYYDGSSRNTFQVPSVDQPPPGTYGDGWLFYPGEQKDFAGTADDKGLFGPISSIRMKSWRRGEQDYEYLWLAKQAGKDITAIVDSIVPHAFDDCGSSSFYAAWPRRGYAYESARLQLAQMLNTSSTAVIVVDGQKDSFYNTLTGPNNGYLQIRSYAYNDNGAPANDADLSAKVWTAWDDEWFCLYEEVMDDTLSANATNVYEEDGIELMVDPQPTDSVTNSIWYTRLTALGTAAGVVAGDSLNNVSASQKLWARRTITGGYALELAIKWSAIQQGSETITPAVGNIFGMAINQHDNDGHARRQASVQWAAVLLDAVWNTPKYLGTVKFLADNKLQFIPTNNMTGVTNPVPYDGSDYPPTGIKNASTTIPETFNLGQNYPNPFNPSTSISFSLPWQSFVSLKVYDILGREVVALVSEKLPGGNHTRQWNAEGLPSGVYFYRLQAGSFTETKKLLLLR